MKFNKSSGQASRLLLVLAIIILVAVIIVYLVMRMAEKPAAPKAPETPQVQLPVYDTTLDNIRFVFESAINLGNALTPSAAKNKAYTYLKGMTTTEKYIQVTVGAQNKTTQNIEQNSWDLGNIVDSEGRNFEPLDQYAVAAWLPVNNGCGALLKPAFDPTPCTKIYEVSKQSSGLKVHVLAGKGGSMAAGSKKDAALIDLIVK